MTKNVNGRNDPIGQNLATPRWLIKALRARGITLVLDVCAEPHTAVCPQYYTHEIDGLAQPWYTPWGWTWCNPPFSSIEPWLAKGAEEAQQNKAHIVYLLPFRPETEWWRNWYHIASRIETFCFRLAYWDAREDRILSSPNFPSCLWFVHTQPGPRTDTLSIRYWDVSKPRNR